MNQKSASNLLIILASLTGIASLATPASAKLTSTKGLLTSTLSPSLTSTTSSTGSGRVLSPIVSPVLETTNSTSGVVTTSQTTTVTQPVQSHLPVLNDTTPIIQNTIDTTAGVSIINNITATLQETTNTTVSSIGGVSTDSQTTATVINPTQVQLPSLSNPTELIQKTGQATLGLQINQQGVTVDAGADLSLGLGNLAQVGICLDGNVSLGSTGRNALADCTKPDEPERVPEPATIGGLGLISAYMMFLKRRLSKSTKVSVS